RPIALRRDLPAEVPTIWADPNRVRQILLNLFSNAIKFTDKGSITLGLQVQRGEAIFSVTDTGVGIAPDEYELIFEEFKQGRAGLSQARKGSGLGLAISRNLVALMGGKIWVESEIGVGSTFYFSLPVLVTEESTVPEPAETPAEATVVTLA
ncbi:MAG: histidine kinase, partial [Anaerolineae bacterium]|nr:histidine kinase [Anaerolineae bacterium]